jgi:hypothetical protein
MQKGIQYTTILHQPRVKAGLTCNEYVIASTIFNLQNNDVMPGWCYAPKDWFAELVGLSRRSVITLIFKLVDMGFVEKDSTGKLLKTTKKWREEIEEFVLSEESSLRRVKKVHTASEESSLQHCEESSLRRVKKVHTIIIDNSNKVNNDRHNVTAANGDGSGDEGQKSNWAKKWATIFDEINKDRHTKDAELSSKQFIAFNWRVKQEENFKQLRNIRTNAIAPDFKTKNKREATDEELEKAWRAICSIAWKWARRLQKLDGGTLNYTPTAIYANYNKIKTFVAAEKANIENNDPPPMLGNGKKCPQNWYAGIEAAYGMTAQETMKYHGWLLRHGYEKKSHQGHVYFKETTTTKVAA